MTKQKRAKGDVRDDGLIFWSYRKDLKSGEYWVSPESFEKKKEQSKKAWSKYSKTEKGRANVAKKESVEKRITSKKQYRKTHRMKTYYKEYAKRPAVIKRRRERESLIAKSRLAYHREWKRMRRRTDPLFRLAASSRCRLYYALKGAGLKKNRGTESYLGCSVDFLKAHIESLFTDGMSWDNHGKWEIDHIIPFAVAKNEEDILRLAHYSNLQPLWMSDNRMKGGKSEPSTLGMP